MLRAALALLVCIASATRGCPVRCSCTRSLTDCSSRGLTSLPDGIDTNILTLHFSDNQLERIEDGWKISPSLRHLWFDKNRLVSVPKLANLAHLETLNLAENRIQEIDDNAFVGLFNLSNLLLQQNHLRYVSSHAFTPLSSLTALELQHNQLTQVPYSVRHLKSLVELNVAFNRVRILEKETFKQCMRLKNLALEGNPISQVDTDTFSDLPELIHLKVSNWIRADFPNLNGTRKLERLTLERSRLESVPSYLCSTLSKLQYLNFRSNKISQFPNLTRCVELQLLDLSYNQISYVRGSLFGERSKLLSLYLRANLISKLDEHTLVGLSNLQILDLEENFIYSIHDETFLPLESIKELNLGQNKITSLPTKGLKNIRDLKVHQNKFLIEFPSPSEFPKVQILHLAYPYHCCAFLNQADKEFSKNNLKETVVWLSEEDARNYSRFWPGFENYSRFDEFAQDLWKHLGKDYAIPEDYSEELLIKNPPVYCTPIPSPFSPCEDLFDWWGLRCGIWMVFLLALLGNGLVVSVLVWGIAKIDVPRFLVANLAMADLAMGLYLATLALVDVTTLGTFKVTGVQWQNSGGCQVAGFLAVLSTELSVYTLAVITLERNYAITHAMHLNKRLSLKHAGYIMACGWIFAITMAILPLYGISDYRKFAICLPFESEDVTSFCYVVFLIIINGVAFLILMGCYLKMYCSIRGSQAWNSNDTRIAKRMALLVFTDFFCWAPIAFFSLTALFGLQLVSLEEAKIFAIFVLPLNSCANPFLYAIFTKQFKKDCVIICKKIEESRVTRGIGRHKHSSNFSNRQTPGNSSERKSYEICQCTLHKTIFNPRYNWIIKYLLCQGQEEPEPNEYAFAIAQIQKRQQKHSFSSETFSSKSDSWRKNAMRNVLRKPSQDSSMSGSRQDSTSTYRVTSTASDQPRLCAYCSRNSSLNNNPLRERPNPPIQSPPIEPKKYIVVQEIPCRSSKDPSKSSSLPNIEVLSSTVIDPKRHSLTSLIIDKGSKIQAV